MVDLFEFTLAEFLDDLVLFLSENGEVTIFSFSLKLSEMFFVEARPCECVLKLLKLLIGSERQKLSELFWCEILSDYVDVKDRGEILHLKNSFGQDNGLTLINKIELTLIDNGFFKTLYRMKIVSKSF